MQTRNNDDVPKIPRSRRHFKHFNQNTSKSPAVSTVPFCSALFRQKFIRCALYSRSGTGPVLAVYLLFTFVYVCLPFKSFPAADSPLWDAVAVSLGTLRTRFDTLRHDKFFL
jgi:hypothetical protein